MLYLVRYTINALDIFWSHVTCNTVDLIFILQVCMSCGGFEIISSKSPLIIVTEHLSQLAHLQNRTLDAKQGCLASKLTVVLHWNIVWPCSLMKGNRFCHIRIRINRWLNLRNKRHNLKLDLQNFQALDLSSIYQPWNSSSQLWSRQLLQSQCLMCVRRLSALTGIARPSHANKTAIRRGAVLQLFVIMMGAVLRSARAGVR